MSLPTLYAFTNTHILSSGQALSQDLYFSPHTGLITPNFTRSRPDLNVTKIDLKSEYVVAPGYLELQMNGGWGVHFSALGKHEADRDEDVNKLEIVAKKLLRCGITAWWATVPTVEEGRWKEIIPALRPRSFEKGATLLGAHVEGPYLHPSKNGAHNSSFFQDFTKKPPSDLYGSSNIQEIIKLITLAPETPGAIQAIRNLRQTYPHITISLGHSTATYSQGEEALQAGAKGLTHVFNAMNPLHHRDPGLVGLTSNNPSTTSASDTLSSTTPQSTHLLSSTTSVSDWLSRQLSALTPPSSPARPECYYSLIPDKIHLHPSLLTLLHRTSPSHSILITDAIELAGLPDGTYPPNDQIISPQLKSGDRATIQGTDTLIGSCITLDQCVRNMIASEVGCTLAEAVRCVTENIARYMSDDPAVRGRGKLEVGCRADFVVLDREGVVRQTWIAGVKAWDVEWSEARESLEEQRGEGPMRKGERLGFRA